MLPRTFKIAMPKLNATAAIRTNLVGRLGLVTLIPCRCTELGSGGRMITNTVLPKPSEEFLKRMMEGRPVERVRVTVSAGDFGYAFD
jgi:hypothetical protein